MRSALLSALVLVLLLAVPQPLGSPGAAESPGPAEGRSAGPRPPSVVIVLLDDMRWDDLPAMPRTNAVVARPGATFENAYSTFPLCCPGRTSVLTGQYAHNHGVLSNVAPLGGVSALRPRHTLAAWLSGQGYATGFVGKYLNGYGVVTSRRYVPPGWTTWEALAEGPFHYRNFTLSLNGRRLRAFHGVQQTRLLGRRSSRFIRRTGDRPFLLVTSFVAPHSGTPHEPDDPTRKESCLLTVQCADPTPAVARAYTDTESGTPMPSSPAYGERDVSDKPPHIQLLPRFRPGTRALHQELFEQRREAIRTVDDQVAALVRTLRRTRRLRDTYVVVTSDNGYLLGEHRVPVGKVHPYEPSVRVPMVMRGPGIPAGSRVEQLVALHDLAPTVLRATRTYGAQTVPLDGRRLLQMVSGDRVGARRDLVLEAGPALTEPDPSSVRRSTPGSRPYRGILTDTGWKYVRYDTGETEMYDLRTDPGELVNLAADPALGDRRRALAAALRRLVDCAGPACLVDAAR
jgi:N-acetylglucosamine-6-sulfatase